MALHPLASSFASVADAYERGRPEYPAAVVAALAGELGLAKGARVLDLAAGTGKLSRTLLSAGLDVVAVEPQQELRAPLAASIGAERVLDGLAERIPLPDGSLDAVTVADAFHWFDAPAALAEIARVLRPRGGLAVLSTSPDWREVSWAHELGQLLRELRPEHPQFDGRSWREHLPDARGWGDARELSLSDAQSATPRQIVDYVASISWIASLPADERSATLARVAQIVASGETPAQLGVNFLVVVVQRTG